MDSVIIRVRDDNKFNCASLFVVTETSTPLHVSSSLGNHQLSAGMYLNSIHIVILGVYYSTGDTWAKT